MKRIKKASVVNKFYTGNPAELSAQIRSFEFGNYNNTGYKSRAVIVPHAGLIYSGRLAFEGINQLDKDLKTLIIFAPAHKVAFDGIAVSSYDEWETPTANIEIDEDITEELVNHFEASYNDEAFVDEHSVEVQIPIIQYVLGNVKIVPVLISNQSTDLITDIIQYYWNNKEIGFIISSDLSHFLKDEDAKKLDDVTAQMIEKINFQGVDPSQACGIIGIIGLCNFARQNNFSLIRIDMINSSEVSNDKSSVVGYGTWFLYEGERDEYIKDYYGNFILGLVKAVIEANLKNERLPLKYPQVLDEMGAVFVTLEKFGRLRGCIGSVGAFRSLILELVEHSADAAFRDPRFKPVKIDEVDDLSITVSILSVPQPIEFSDEQDLLEKIVPFKDGLIINDGDYRAVYLPSVWEQIPDKKEFLTSLKLKAGMKPNHFSPDFQAYRFKTTEIR